MREELKDCPFCGEPAQEVELSFAGTYFNNTESFIRCSSCSARTRTHTYLSDAIGEWNSRPIEDTLLAQIDRLEKMLEGA